MKSEYSSLYGENPSSIRTEENLVNHCQEAYFKLYKDLYKRKTLESPFLLKPGGFSCKLPHIDHLVNMCYLHQIDVKTIS